ncbi:MAG TPA: hypothetical protein VGO80_09570 [Solirubrobacteraceae bacterium]|nr:hypothetical protein [Solirubrobacteraceae bacterium]
MEDLHDLCLEPDGRYQTRPVTLRNLTAEVVERLASAFSQRSPETFPHLVCITGKCRTGSTALTNLFGIADVPAYYQPVKTILRHRVLDGPGAPWDVPDALAEAVIAAKEMTGPYSVAECLFNPLECLIEAGYPRTRLHLLLLDRDPYESLASWLSKWSDRLPRDELVGHFVLSSVNAERLHDYAVEQEIDAVTYVYALSRWPHEAVAALFGRLGIGERFHDGVVDDWGARGAIESERSAVVFPDEPEVYRFAGLHSSEVDYCFKARDTSGVTADDRSSIEDTSLVESYQRSLERSCRDLELPDAIRDQLVAIPLSAPA